MLLLGLGACCVPGVEVHREATTVTGVEADTVVACTWSRWMPFEQGCDHVAIGARGGAGWHVPQWDSGGPFVFILGEAPLMQTLFVACEAGQPVGATFVPWEESVGPETRIERREVRLDVLTREAFGNTEEGFRRQVVEVCAGRGRRPGA